MHCEELTEIQGNAVDEAAYVDAQVKEERVMAFQGRQRIEFIPI